MRTWFKIEWVALAAAACILGYLLFIKPILGVADNGDFLRIMGTVGLQYTNPAETFEDRYFGYAHTKYAWGPVGLGGYISTEIILVFLAIILNKLVHPQLFDIRFLALIYSALLLTALYLLLRWKPLKSPLLLQIAAAVLFLVIFVDVGYSSYYNSLFGEPISFVFLLFTTALALRLAERELPGVGLLVAWAASVVFLVGSKVQNAPVGFILFLLGLRFLSLRGDRVWRRSVIGLSAFILLVAAGIYLTAPKELRVINQYQSVFYGILKDSPNPEQDLRELGLSPKLAVLAGTNYFTPNTSIPQQDPSMQELFYSRISHGKIAKFYLTHPSRYLDKLQVTANNAMTIRPYYLGSYEKSDGMERGIVSTTYGIWSEWKKNHLPNKLWFLVLFFGFYFIVLLAKYTGEPSQARRVALEVFASIGLIGVISFAVPLIGDGEADMQKHLFLFNVCFDMMFVASLLWLVNVISTAFRKNRTL